MDELVEVGAGNGWGTGRSPRNYTRQRRSQKIKAGHMIEIYKLELQALTVAWATIRVDLQPIKNKEKITGVKRTDPRGFEGCRFQGGQGMLAGVAREGRGQLTWGAA